MNGRFSLSIRFCALQARSLFRVPSNDDDLLFGNTKQALLINVFLLLVAMLDAFDRNVEALVLFFHLCPVLDNYLDDIGKCWFHILSVLFEYFAHMHWKIILDSAIG
jgi:hypothetical protein